MAFRAVLLVLLLSPVALGQHWEFEQVDSVAGVNNWANAISIDRLPDGRCCVCYAAGDTVRVATRDSVWTYEDVALVQGIAHPWIDVSALGAVTVCYTDADTVRYAVRDSGWIVSTLPYPGLRPKLSHDPQGRPHVVYQEPGEPRVLYSTRADSVWSLDTLHAGGRLGYWYVSYPPPVFDTAGYPLVLAADFFDYSTHVYGGGRALLRIVDGDVQTIWEISQLALTIALALATDSAGEPGSCWWARYDVEWDVVCRCADTIGVTSSCGSLRYDDSDRPCFAWREGLYEGGDLLFEWRSDAGWRSAVVYDSERVVLCDLELGEDGQPLIAFRTQFGRILLARGVDVVGMEAGPAERGEAEVPYRTVYRASELVRLDCRVIDALGRDVTDRRGRLAPGVYLLRSASGGEHPEAGVTKVIIQP